MCICKGYTSHTTPRFWRRYVDDTYTALPSNLVDSFHDHLNSIDPCIQYTIERESDGQLSFPSLTSSWTEKKMAPSAPLCTERPHRSVSVLSLPPPCSPQTSCGEDTDVQNTALSSTGVSRVQEEKLVSQALQGNGYPKGFIHKHTCPQSDQRTPRDQMARRSVTLSYISGLSESIRRVLPPLAIQVTFRLSGSWGRSLCTPRTQYQPIAGKVWCTASHVLNTPAPTLAQRVGPWTIVFVNITGLWRTET